MKLLQIIMPIPINTGPSKPMSEYEVKVFTAIFIILVTLFIISILYELYKQYREGDLIDWEDLILVDNIARSVFHALMVLIIGAWALIYSGMILAQYL